MAIQAIDLTVPGGDTPRSANTKINANFSDQTHAASKLIGTETGEIPLAQDVRATAFGYRVPDNITGSVNDYDAGALFANKNVTDKPPHDYSTIFTYQGYAGTRFQIGIPYNANLANIFIRARPQSTLSDVPYAAWGLIYTSQNTIKEASTGYLKASSPILYLYNDNLEKEHEAVEQDIVMEKLGTGDYLIKGSTGLRNEGWSVSPPKDIHGNVLCMVEATEADGNINIKTYKRKFDFDIVAIVPDYDQPFDIPAGRSVDLRLNDLPATETNNP